MLCLILRKKTPAVQNEDLIDFQLTGCKRPNDNDDDDDDDDLIIIIMII